MPQIIKEKSTVLAVVTDLMSYVKARKEVEELTRKHGLTVADMPMVIQAMCNHPEVRDAIPRFVDTITGEYHGQRDGGRSYEVWHSVGSLTTVEGLEQAISNTGNYGFFRIDDSEWAAIGEGRYDGQDVVRVHLEDLKIGSVPAPGTPYAVFVRVYKDKPNFSFVNTLLRDGSDWSFQNDIVQLGYDMFMRDDRVLMIAGSPDIREALAKMLFGTKKDGGKGLKTAGNNYEVSKIISVETNIGCLVRFSNSCLGLSGNYGKFYPAGCFLGIGDGVAQLSARGATREKSSKDFEQYPIHELHLDLLNDFLERNLEHVKETRRKHQK